MAEKNESMIKMALPMLLIGTVVVVIIGVTGNIMTSRAGSSLRKYPGFSQVMASRQGSGRNPSSFPVAF